VHVAISDLNHEKVVVRSGAIPYLYKTDPQDEVLLNRMAHNREFRSGFWRYTLERIFVIEAWHRNFPHEGVFHLESDILVFPNFPWRAIREKSKLSWLRFNESHDVAAIIYSPNLADSQWLAESVRKKIEENFELTDMTVLSVISREEKNRVALLPSLLDQSESDGSELQLASTLVEPFDGIFDPAAIGMWLLGQDPRNHRGLLIKYRDMDESWVKPGKWKFKYSNKEGLTFTSLRGSESIFNLHVHCKGNVYFSRLSNFAIHAAVLQANLRIGRLTFKPVVFLYLLKKFLLARIKRLSQR
jgi:hypothetical protein